MMKQTKQEAPRTTQAAGRPPIVAVLGHVDHGKTTLLDTIRKAHVAAREHGGITQHIGAYQVEENGQKITFIDTPGHEAFAAMRSRGATTADIALLVVAADDSVMPQTKESITQIKLAGIPFIVVANKIDMPGANLEKLKTDLAKNGVQVEGFGGDVPMAPVSAKVGTGIKELLDLITLVAQMKEYPSEPTAPLEAAVVETRLDKGKGMIASVIVKKGTLKFGSRLFDGAKDVGRVRAMFDEYGKSVTEAGPSKPVEILGFTALPQIGAMLHDVAVAVAAPAAEAVKQEPLSSTNLPDWLKPVDEQELRKLNIVLKADTAGSLEAILLAFSDRIRVVASGVGDINEADIMFAKSAKAFVVGFNVKAVAAVEKLAQTEKVVFRVYKIIYELLDELEEVVSGMKEVLTQERELGQGTIIAEFPFEKQRIAGTRVTAGRFARGDSVRVMRGETEIARAKVKSIRQGKNEVNKAEAPIECGIFLDHVVAFELQDVIIAITTG